MDLIETSALRNAREDAIKNGKKQTINHDKQSPGDLTHNIAQTDKSNSDKPLKRMMQGGYATRASDKNAETLKKEVKARNTAEKAGNFEKAQKHQRNIVKLSNERRIAVNVNELRRREEDPNTSATVIGEYKKGTFELL